MSRILITTTSFGQDDPGPLELLREAGYEVITNPHKRKLSEDEVLDLLLQFKPVGMIAGVEPITARVLQRTQGLKAVSRCGVGMDNVDLEAARDVGIVVTNTPDAPTQSVAELTVGLILNLLRKISLHDREIRQGNWNKQMGSLLQGKRVGIIGLGRIGKRVAEMLLALGAQVAGTDLRPDSEWLSESGVTLFSLDGLLKQSQILCLHVSHTSGSGYLIGRSEMEAMPAGAFLVNTSRGEAIDQDALYSMLTGGHLAGAALDVFDYEPYTGPLSQLHNVVLTPHVGSYAREARIEMEMQSARNLVDELRRGA